MSATSVATRWFPAAESADECQCGEPGCLGHEVIGGGVQLPGFTSKAVMAKSPHEIVAFTCPLTEAVYAPGELTEPEVVAHQGLFLHRWRPL
jgi:hypothetical protein